MEKLKWILRLCFFFLLVSCQERLSMSDKYQKITVTEADSVLEFRITDQDVTPDPEKTYWSYHLRNVHRQQGGYQGQLLNGEYAVYDDRGSLLSQGAFRMGLKHGIWKFWSGGNVFHTLSYRNGNANGKYRALEGSNILVSGRYANDQKEGVFLYETDTAKTGIRYSKGTPVDTLTAKKVVWHWMFRGL